MNNKNRNSFVKDIRLRIVSSQNEKLEDLKYYARKEFKVSISKTSLIRIALTELINRIKSKDDLKKILEKYNYI